MNHRGPDEGDDVAVGPAHLVFRRLALLDLVAGQQPVSDERGRFWSVFNGEIYNHAELHRELLDRGHRLHGHGDSELIPHLYEEWGPDFVIRLRGMFALALFDSDRDELFLARDRFGIKPLFVLRTAQHVLFASEARTVMAAAGGLAPDADALWHYLTFGYVPDPMTPWQGLVKVPPAHVAIVRAGEISLRRYWEPALMPMPPRPLSDSADLVEAAVRDSVAAHLVADVPVGSYLSSGVDSSYLAALAAAKTHLHTFSVGFEHAQGASDELASARALADRIGSEHHEEVVTAQEYLAELPGIVAAQEGPLADPSAPALWFLARAAAREVKSVLSGEGADELFAGYPIFRQAKALRPFALLPPPAQAVLHRIAARAPEGWRGRGLMLRGTTPLEQRFVGNAPLFGDDDKRRLLAPAFDGAFPAPSWTLLARRYAETQHLPDLLRMQDASLHTWLPSDILMKADKMAMAHSLEVRVPFLDPLVFDVAARLPMAHRVQGRQTKVALRAAAARVLPATAAARPKLGFPVPFRSWLDSRIGESLRDLADDASDDVFDRSALRDVLTQDRRPDYHRRQWALLVYLLWRQSYEHPSVGRRLQRPA